MKDVSMKRFFILLFLEVFHVSLIAQTSALAAQDSRPEYLLITSESLLVSLEPLVRWRIESGFVVTIKTSEEIFSEKNFSSPSFALKNFLREHFQSRPNLMYVLLVGSSRTLPPQYEEGFSSDYGYSLLGAEDDIWPDVYLGRFPSDREEEIAFLVNKTIDYEQKEKKEKIFSAILISSDPGVGMFDQEFSFGGEFLFSQSKKAVAIITPSSRISPQHQAYFQEGALIAQGVSPTLFSPATRLGQILYRAKTHVYREKKETTKAKRVLYAYNLFGDPALLLRSPK